MVVKNCKTDVFCSGCKRSDQIVETDDFIARRGPAMSVRYQFHKVEDVFKDASKSLLEIPFGHRTPFCPGTHTAVTGFVMFKDDQLPMDLVNSHVEKLGWRTMVLPEILALGSENQCEMTDLILDWFRNQAQARGFLKRDSLSVSGLFRLPALASRIVRRRPKPELVPNLHFCRGGYCGTSLSAVTHDTRVEDRIFPCAVLC